MLVSGDFSTKQKCYSCAQSRLVVAQRSTEGEECIPFWGNGEAIKEEVTFEKEHRQVGFLYFFISILSSYTIIYPEF
jgi:hypothetical protein